MESDDEKINKIAAETWSQLYVEELKSIFAAETQAIRAALIINGGAAVALLGFLASIINNSGDDLSIISFAKSLFLFTSGVLSAAVSYWVVYWAQSNHAHYRYNNNLKWRKTVAGMFTDLATLLIASSYGLFGYASFVIYNALLQITSG